jgi:signal peptidase I
MTASEDERRDVTGGQTPTEHGSGDPERVEPTPEEASHPTSADGEAVTPAKPKKKSGSFWKELPILIVIALVLTFLIQTFLAKVYVIPSASMEQTLNGCTGCTGDRILVDKVTFDFTDPKPGDVIVFKGPPGWENSEYQVSESSNVFVRWVRQFASSIGIGAPPEYDLVKRVIAVGGQTISCCDSKNRVVVDGKPLNESYLYLMPGTAPVQQSFPAVTVPQGDLWMMGDNRNDSYDSRYQNGGGIKGVVPVSDVIGVARTIIWPPTRWRGIGELDPQSAALGLPYLPPVGGLPVGIGTAFAWPALWLGRRARRGLRAAGPPALRRKRR